MSGPFKMNGWTPFHQNEEKYKYQLVDSSGKVVINISKKEYIDYKNEPGDKPTKTTTDPDVYGRKKGGSPLNPK